MHHILKSWRESRIVNFEFSLFKVNSLSDRYDDFNSILQYGQWNISSRASIHASTRVPIHKYEYYHLGIREYE